MGVPDEVERIGTGTSTVLGNPLRISRNALRCCSGSTRGRDCLQPLECEFEAEFRDGRGDVQSGVSITSEQSRYSCMRHAIFT